MASIKTYLSLYDGMTGPLKNITQAMNVVLSTMESMQAASGNSIDTASIDSARKALAKADVEIDSIEKNMQQVANKTQQAEKKQWKYNDAIKKGEKSSKGLMDNVSGIVGAYVSLQSAEKLIGLSDQMSGTTARLNMIVDDGGSVEDLEQKIMDSANRSRASYLTMAESISKIGVNTGDLFNNDELIQFTENLNKQFVIAGASAEEIDSAMTQLTQSMGAGVLRGEELNAVMYAAPGIIQNIVDYMGIERSELKDIAEQGKITADIVKNAMLQATNEINQQFEQMPVTWAQLWNQFQNVGIKALQPVLGLLSQAPQWIMDNWSMIEPIVVGALAAITAGVLMFVGAQLLALATNPFFWIALAIGAVIVAIYKIVQAYNDFTGASISAAGVVAGVFSTLFAHVYNHFIVPIQNVFAAIANFIGNVFNDPVAAVKVLFYDMAETVLGYIANIAHGIESLINAIPGVEVSITGWIDDIYNNVKAASQQVKDESGWKEYVKAWEYKDYEESFLSGYNYGAGVSDTISDAFNGITDPSSGLQNFGTGNQLSDIGQGVGDTAANTAAMRDSMDITNEDLAYLRDIAEREAINRFTTAEITINQQNENHIASDLDADGIMSAWTAGFVEQLNISAEGVHA